MPQDFDLPVKAKAPPLRAKPRFRRWLRLLVFAALLALGYWVWDIYQMGAPPDAGRQIRSSRGAEPAPAAAPVHVAQVTRSDFPVFVNGLGNVQATNAVTVRSRVDGQIVKVAFQEGQLLHEGDLLVQIDPAPYKAAYDQAVAKLAQDQANLSMAKLEQARTATLAKQGWATTELREQRDSAVVQLTAQLQADTAAIESAKVQLDYTTIRAPLTGQAGFRLIDPGNIIHAGDPGGVLTITQLQPISVVFTAPEQQLPEIQKSLKSAPVKVLAYSSDGRTLLSEGKLMLVDNQVDMASGTIRLKASFTNQDNRLWPGLSVSTRLLVNTLKDVVTVPDTAVQRGRDGLFAFVVGKDDKAELRPLKVGPIADGRAVIQKGLSPGERIVISGHYRVQPGGRLEILPDGNTPAKDKQAHGEVD